MKKILLYSATIFVIIFSSCKMKETILADPNKFTDNRDGQVYKTVKIGNQVWLAENLRYLPSVSDPTIGAQNTPHYYVYGYNGNVVADAKNLANYANHGVLYNWSAAMLSAPVGWHLPTLMEWKELETFCGGDSITGGKLKETGFANWASPNISATNEFGFNARGSGWRLQTSFDQLNRQTHWWSSTEILSN